MILPTSRCILLVVVTLPVATLPLSLGASGWFVWLAVVAALLLLVGIEVLTLWGRKVEVAIDGPAIVPLGSEAAFSIRLLHPQRKGVSESCLLEAPNSLTADVAPVELLDGGDREAAVDIGTTRRGEYTLGVRLLESSWFGLMQRVTVRKGLLDLLVPINRVRVRELAIQSPAIRSERQGVRMDRQLGEGSQFDSLREWVPGLDTKHIDWKTTARLGRPYWREHHVERDQLLVLGIDMGPAMGEEIEGLSRLDHAIESALALAIAALRAGDRVIICGFDTKLRHVAGPFSGVGKFGALAEAASRMAVSDQATNLVRGLKELAQVCSSRAFMVLFTEFMGGGVHEMAFPAFQALARRHALVHVTFENQFLRRVTDSSPDEEIDLFRALVARGMIRERKMLLKRLQSRGLEVVECAARATASSVIEKWLQMKRQRRVA